MLRELFRHAAALLRERWLLWLCLALLAAAGAVALFPRDAEWSRACEVANKQFAGDVSFWGDFPRGWLILLAVLGVLGWRLRKRHWRVIALAALIAGTFAGAQVQIISSLTGRPRPSTGVADCLHGPTLDRNYKSFPSAHATCAFAVATALVVMLPALGVPCLLAAALVAWSRMALTAHYPSDVWVGIWFGIINGLLFGLAARRLKDAETPAA